MDSVPSDASVRAVEDQALLIAWAEVGVIVFICFLELHTLGWTGFWGRQWPWSLMAVIMFGIVLAYSGIIYFERSTGKKLSSHQRQLFRNSLQIVVVVYAIILFSSLLWGYTSRELVAMWPIPLLVVAIFCLIAYFTLYSIFRPVTDEQLRNLRETELDLPLPYETAFELGEAAFRMLTKNDFTEKFSSDKDAGIITMNANTLLNVLFSRPSSITLSFQENSPGTTRVKISSITIFRAWRRSIFRKPSGLNQQYVDRVARYLLEKTKRAKEGYSPEEIHRQHFFRRLTLVFLAAMIVVLLAFLTFFSNSLISQTYLTLLNPLLTPTSSPLVVPLLLGWIPLVIILLLLFAAGRKFWNIWSRKPESDEYCSFNRT